MKKIVVIAAAGKGNRLGAGMPKCLVEINGHAIFEYLLKAFEWADEIRMVVGYKAELVKEKVQAINLSVKFIENREYETTNTLQSNYLGMKGTKDLVLFIDGDMIISKKTSKYLLDKYNENEECIGVTKDISEQPVFAEVQECKVQGFDYEKRTEFEWANIALLNPNKLEYLPTYFFTQIQKFLPIDSLEVERLEVDTRSDLEYTERQISEHPEKYDYWKV